MEDCFDKEWIRSLFTLGLQRLRTGCESAGKIVHYELFERYDLEEAPFLCATCQGVRAGYHECDSLI